jgi:hypothetical protein
MSRALIEAVERFTEPQDETQLQQLEEAVGTTRPEDCGQPEFRALLSVFERFPEDDGYGIFWSIVHCLEASQGYESALIESVSRCPAEFNLLMVNRLINGGVTEIEGRSLLSVLASVASNHSASARARKLAQGFIEYQGKQGHTDA